MGEVRGNATTSSFLCCSPTRLGRNVRRSALLLLSGAGQDEAGGQGRTDPTRLDATDCSCCAGFLPAHPAACSPSLSPAWLLGLPGWLGWAVAPVASRRPSHFAGSGVGKGGAFFHFFLFFFNPSSVLLSQPTCAFSSPSSSPPAEVPGLEVQCRSGLPPTILLVPDVLLLLVEMKNSGLENGYSTPATFLLLCLSHL